jgi:hypothetical protein
MTNFEAIKIRNVILTQPKRGYFNLCIQEADGTFKRYAISRNDVCELVVRGADMAFSYREEV